MSADAARKAKRAFWEEFQGRVFTAGVGVHESKWVIMASGSALALEGMPESYKGVRVVYRQQENPPVAAIPQEPL